LSKNGVSWVRCHVSGSSPTPARRARRRAARAAGRLGQFLHRLVLQAHRHRVEGVHPETALVLLAAQGVG